MKKILKPMFAAATAMSMLLSFSSFSSASATSTLLGDINGDGYRNSVDATALNSFLHGRCFLSNLSAADVDYDGVISRADNDRLCSFLAHQVSLPTNLGSFSVNGNNYRRRYTVHNYQNNQTTSYSLNSAMSHLDLVSTYSNELDDRVPATDSSVVQLTSNYGNGTGFIVDDHIIATAAHCVFRKDNNTFKSNLKVKINGSVNLNPIEVHIPETYVNLVASNTDALFAMDYALIYVEEDLSQYGAFDMGYPSDQFMSSGTTVTLCGYPYTVNGTSANNQLYKATGSIYDINGYNGTLFDFQIMSDAYGSQGDNGGPVYMTTYFGGNEYHVVVGIYTSNYDNNVNDYMGFGTRITQPLLRFYYNNDHIGSTIS